MFTVHNIAMGIILLAILAELYLTYQLIKDGRAERQAAAQKIHSLRSMISIVQGKVSDLERDMQAHTRLINKYHSKDSKPKTKRGRPRKPKTDGKQ
jgi:hypothetical protein